MGGYFGGNERLPAAKFNAGQKIFFWLAAIAGLVLSITKILMYIAKNDPVPMLAEIYTLHDLTALLFLLMIMAHIYLGLIVNPKTFKTILGGIVELNWLKKHHQIIVKF